MAAARNTPLAFDDTAAVLEDGALTIDVLANDRGGAARSIHAVGTPAAGSWSGVSALGAVVTVVDGRILYDAGASAMLQGLASGETITDTFTYALRVGNGVVSTATVQVQVTGANDLSAADIVVSGASGTNGTFRAGDTVTVRVDAGGFEAMADGVQVSFASLGGPAAVPAVPDGGTYLASWVVAGGSIDTAGAAVTVQVTSPLGDTVAADSASFGIDSQAPALGAGDIAISGGSGPGGAFRAGDLLTVTVPAALLAGDAGSVTVDFSALGGPAHAAAVLVGAGYAAGFQLPGAAAGTSGSIGVTVTDDAGNTASAASGVVAVAAPVTAYSLEALTTISFSNSGDEAWDLAVQADGAILIAAGARMNEGGYGGDFAMARVTAAGVLDTGFGIGGKVVTDMGGGRAFARDVLALDDGTILLGGSAEGQWRDFALARYTAEGALDASFGAGGIVIQSFTPGEDELMSLQLLPDGSVRATGFATPGARDFVSASFTAGGALDTSWGTGGVATTSVTGGSDVGLDSTLQADGRLVAAGYAEVGPRSFAVVRYNADGSLDGSFGAGGMATYALRDAAVAYAVAQQADGKLLLAGSSFSGGQADTAIIRLNADGSLDTSFGTAGRVIIGFGSGSDGFYNLAVQADGRIVASGVAHNGANADALVARFLPDGTLDAGFGDGGHFMVAVGAGTDQATGLALTGDPANPTIVFGGTTQGSVDGDVFVGLLVPGVAGVDPFAP